MTNSELLTIIEKCVCNLFPDELTGVDAAIKTVAARKQRGYFLAAANRR